MSHRVCAVTMTDLRGIRHTAEVTADSLFEAAILAIQHLKRQDGSTGIGPQHVWRSTCKLPLPTSSRSARFSRGSRVRSRVPAERLKRDRLKAMLKEAGAA
jgi:hypothetical protein